MVTIKWSLFCLLILMLTVVSYTSCQGSTNGTEVTTTEKPEDDDATESADVKDESESESETEVETESESENDSESESDTDESDSDDKGEGEGAEKPETTGETKKSKEPEKLEKSERKRKVKKDDEIDLEDDAIPKPRCLTRYNNLNCTEAQQQQAINNYKSTRGQLIQTLLQTINSSGLSNNKINNNNNNTNVTIPATVSTPSNTNSTSSSVFTLTNTNGSAILPPPPSSTATSSIAAINLITSEISSCNRAILLLNSVDKYLRFNDSCQARVFGKKYNPDYWISRCMRSLRRHH